MKKEYEVGFCKPPKHSRFKPGQSGNSKGRKKGSKNLATIIKAIANKKLRIKEDGKYIKMTPVQLMYLHTFTDAAKGNFRATKFLHDTLKEMEITDAQKEQIKESILSEGKEILLAYLKNNAEKKDDK